MQFRRAQPADAAGLAGFAARTFAETYGADNRPEHLAAHLAASYGIAQQASELARRLMDAVHEAGAGLGGRTLWLSV